MTDKPIPGFTSAMRQECTEIAERQSVSIYELHDAGSFNDGCAAAADAILAMPVAPPFPEPLRVKPEMGSWYWAGDPCVSNFCSQFAWDDEGIDNRLLERGLCHATREAAEAHGRYLASLSAKPEGGV